METNVGELPSLTANEITRKTKMLLQSFTFSRA